MYFRVAMLSRIYLTIALDLHITGIILNYLNICLFKITKILFSQINFREITRLNSTESSILRKHSCKVLYVKQKSKIVT